jgi:2-methylcitrate dehydratase PrpD
MDSSSNEKDHAGKYTDIIVNYIDGFHYEMIPADVIQYAKMVIMDTLGVTWAAPVKKTEISRRIIEFVHAVDQMQESTVIGSKYKSSAINAALANGTMAHDIVELDEVHNRAVTHTAAVIVPAALAVCEREEKSGRDLIAAVVSAFDIECRLGIALEDTSIYARNFHPTSVCGGFGAAVAAAYLLQLEKEEIRSAMALAGCQASGLIAWETELHHMSKSFQSGMAARNGVTAALMAKMKFLGPPAIFDGKYNVFDAFSDKRNYHLLVDALGSRFEILGAGLKQYSSCRHTHTPLDAFMKIILGHDLAPQEIKKITVRATEVAALMTDNNNLPTHNTQLVLSMAAFDRKIEVEQYLQERYKDPEVVELSKRVEYIVDPELTRFYPEKWGAIVTVETPDGRNLSERVDYPKGDPKDPFTFDELKEKFMYLLIEGVEKERLQRVVEILEKLETIENIKELSLLLSA